MRSWFHRDLQGRFRPKYHQVFPDNPFSTYCGMPIELRKIIRIQANKPIWCLKTADPLMQIAKSMLKSYRLLL
jgi:hypothetical protein